MTDAMTANIFAPLLAGVRRYSLTQLGPVEGGQWVHYAEVLAALAAAYPADLAEAGKVLKRLVDWPTCDWNTVIQLRKDAHAQITALLARIAAQEAQIKGLEAELHTMKTAGIIEVAVRNPSVFDYMKHWEGRAEAAEAHIAALTARVEGLTVALERLEAYGFTCDAGPLSLCAEWIAIKEELSCRP